MKRSSPVGPIILGDCAATNLQSIVIKTTSSLPNVALSNFKEINVNNIQIGNLLMSYGTVTGLNTINDIVITNHISRHILGGQDEIPISFSTPSTVSEFTNTGISNDIPKADHVHAHDQQQGGTLHSEATPFTNGFMSSVDKIKLDQINPSDEIPNSIGTVFPGISNEYSRPDHVHAHANQTGDLLHSPVSNLSNGFMTANDMIKISKFSWNQSQTSLYLNQGSMRIITQPFGYYTSTGENLSVPSGVSSFVSFYTTQKILTGITYYQSEYIIQYPGIYFIDATFTPIKINNGILYGFININDTKTVGVDYSSASTSPTTYSSTKMNSIIKLSSLDRIGIKVFQSTGVNVNITSVGIMSQFSIKMLYGDGPQIPIPYLPIWTQTDSRSYVFNARSGSPVSVSGDGLTYIYGIPGFSSSRGTCVIMVKDSGVWITQASDLFGTGSTGIASQGYSVAISNDGNTCAIGGPFDNSSVGATWVFIKVVNVWTQQGSKLVGTFSMTSSGGQGQAICLSANGDTLVSTTEGGVSFVFTRTAGIWTQQGSEIVMADAIGTPYIYSNSISADGNTLVVGNWKDNSNNGAVWVFTRSIGVWTQQVKLICSGNIGLAFFGISVCISGDGNTISAGGYGDNNFIGAAWIFVKIDSVWSQQAKIVGARNIGNSSQGYGISLSSNGDIVAFGGPADNSGKGAIWTAIRSGISWIKISKLIGVIGSPVFPRNGSVVSLSSNGNVIVTGTITGNEIQSNRCVFVFEST